LLDYDRYAPLFPDQPACDWPRARQIVEESYQAFSPRAGSIIREFFDKSWMDAELRPGKRGGAFSSSAVPSVHPYILMNYTDKLRDVMTLAHELGHGLHQYLSRPVGYLQCDTPLTTAETASVFGELLVLALVQKYKQDGKAFVPKYLELLSSGGSEAPHVLLARLGVDVTDPGFWELGLKLLGDMVAEAETLASKVGN